ncbi:MAG: hypothetical protein ACRDMA_05430 [Solirubrobacterales bacterium]
MRRIALLAAVLAITALTGCGEGDDGGAEGAPPEAGAPSDVAGDADPEAVKVISAWSEALRRGDIDAAADLFAIPSVAENGPILVRIDSEQKARLFNQSLPCGGRLIRAEGTGELTTATFRLTERPGPGSCGDGTGETAKTAFVIRDGEIVEWRRVGEGQPTAPGTVT